MNPRSTRQPHPTARMLHVLITLLTVLLLHIPCTSAAAESVRSAAHTAQTMSCCSSHTNVHAPALCCTVRAQPAVTTAAHLSLPDLTPAVVLIAPLYRTTARSVDRVRPAVSPPPPVLHTILRI